jgi:octaprenyl-diphosphate synthase
LSTENYQSVLVEARNAVAPGLERADALMQEIAHATHGELRSRMLKVLERPGKRIRSTLLLQLATLGQGEVPWERASRAAASIELLHLASLLHDDVIDDTEMRRGQPTAHALWGNQMAVLVGDYTLSQALELVVGDEDKRIPVMISRASSRLVAGEVMELDYLGRTIGIEEYYHVIDGKTAALIESAAGCGAALAGYDDEWIERASQMGSHFGIGFQIIDDLLDYGVGAADLGKAKFSDLANEVMTLPLIYFYQDAEPAQIREMEELRSRIEEEEGVATQVVSLLQKTGSFEKTHARAMDHVGKALEILNALPESEARRHLLQMLSTMTGRSS